MSGHDLRQLLYSLKKEMRALRAHQRIEDDRGWLSGVLFGLVNRNEQLLSYGDATAFAHASFKAALPAPDQGASVEKAVARLAPFVELLGESAFGWIYQLFCEPLREASLRTIQSSNKECSDAERIAFTQIYTPDWVSDYLLEQCQRPSPPQDLLRHLPSLLDPACGAGNILLRGLEFYATRNNQSKQPYAAALAGLFGADIDPAALFIANLSLIARVCRAKEKVVAPPNLICMNSFDLGSLERNLPPEHFLSRTFDAVVTNPPYIGRKLLDRKLKEPLKQAYPMAHHDLSAAFLLRGIELLNPGGKLAMITQSAQFFLPSFADMRKEVISKTQIDVFVELGPRSFPLQTGEKINSALIVLSSSQTLEAARFVDLSAVEGKERALRSPQQKVYSCNQARFLEESHCAFNYKAPSFLSGLSSVSTTLGELADLRQGLATTDNARFVRQYWQVDPSEIGSRWMPYAKGAGSERWWFPIETVVLWENDGEAIKQAVRDAYPYLNGKTAWVVKNETHYFKPGLVFSFVNNKQFCARELPAGCIFDVGASAIFPYEEPYFVLGFINSSFSSLQAGLLNPTINFQVGDLKKLKVPQFDIKTRRTISKLAAHCVAIKQAITETSGTVCGASAKPLSCDLSTWSEICIQRITRLQELENEIDALVLNQVCSLLELSKNNKQELEALCFEQKSRRREPSIFPATTKDLELLKARTNSRCAPARSRS